MKLRKATMADAKKILEWKNYPETRKFAILSHRKVKLQEHLKWFKKNLQYYKIINNRVGAVRVQDKEIAIWIDRKFWGQGLATRAIKLISKKGFVAKIVEGNIASKKAFIKAGYKPFYSVWKK
jgi:RimJ/RimL family protein N-acetyltransferase